MAHKGLKPEECGVCGKQFPTKGLLTNHCKNHFKEKAFRCELCDKEFMRLVTLKKHVKYAHGHGTTTRIPPIYDDRPSRKLYGESKPFKCDECDATFTTNGKFLAHQHTHRPNKQYKCEECGMCFAKSYTLEVHMQMHQTMTPVMMQPTPMTTSVAPATSVMPIITIPAATNIPQTSGKLATYVKVPQRSAVMKQEPPNYEDPLAVATAAAQVTPDLVENLIMPEQHLSYMYHYPPPQTKTVYSAKFRK
ncbi:hypothetical protein Pmani_021570 [Petrolisthes manimaculis]|uniref:C2H2-type domain-containing protein n=1 Tax=Petrolisthes manimaculis TaxID=1843537 RepID=A0AAE1U5B8_9EUCA|nr:hypothetical protein Pmani_021570 [Petrolisthes manimaculis]